MPPPILHSPRWPSGRRLALAGALVLVVVSCFIGVVAESALGMRPAPDRYNIWAWEARNLPAKWLYLAGSLFRENRSQEQQNADIIRFFELVREINSLERDPEANATLLEQHRRERDALENHVEATLEARITAVLKDFGLTRDLAGVIPLGVFPPVDFEFTTSPRNLVTSPRDRIELTDTELLAADLSIEQIEAIEEELKTERNVSALAAPTAGIGAYPSIVAYLGSYEATLEVAAHEWMHNYLFFSPLGFNYYANNDIRTMNEVVADLVGHEVADEVVRRWPLSATDAAASPAPDAPPAAEEPVFDLRTALRGLREEVDVLLAAGRIEEAEALMERRRDEIEAEGVYIRKINQAYFAFTNLYAGEDGSPGAVNPIGPMLDQLRSRSDSLQAFVHTVSRFTSITQLEEALTGLEGSQQPEVRPTLPRPQAEEAASLAEQRRFSAPSRISMQYSPLWRRAIWTVSSISS